MVTDFQIDLDIFNSLELRGVTWYVTFYKMCDSTRPVAHVAPGVVALHKYDLTPRQFWPRPIKTTGQARSSTGGGSGSEPSVRNNDVATTCDNGDGKDDDPDEQEPGGPCLALSDISLYSSNHDIR